MILFGDIDRIERESLHRAPDRLDVYIKGHESHPISITPIYSLKMTLSEQGLISADDYWHTGDGQGILAAKTIAGNVQVFYEPLLAMISYLEGIEAIELPEGRTSSEQLKAILRAGLKANRKMEAVQILIATIFPKKTALDGKRAAMSLI